MSLNMNTIPSVEAPSLRIGTRLSNALNCCLPFNLFDDAVADIFCLQTSTHGTSPKAYNGIMMMGADPNYGGRGGESNLYKAFGMSHADAVKNMGEESGWNCKNRFFVFPHECPGLIQRFQPRVYAVAACVGENCSAEQSTLQKIPIIIGSFFQSLCSPTLKFRFREEDSVKFEHDKTFSETTRMAAFTEEAISADHIGLYGSFCQGLKGGWASRIKQNPGQFAKGLIKLVVSVALVALAIFGAIVCPAIAIALIAYCSIKGAVIIGRFTVPLIYEALRHRVCDNTHMSKELAPA